MNKIVSISAKEVAEAISAARSMQILRLEGNTVGVAAAKGIAAALEKHPEFEVNTLNHT